MVFLLDVMTFLCHPTPFWAKLEKNITDLIYMACDLIYTPADLIYISPDLIYALGGGTFFSKKIHKRVLYNCNNIRRCSRATQVDSIRGDSSFRHRSFTLLQFTSYWEVTMFTAWSQFCTRFLREYQEH